MVSKRTPPRSAMLIGSGTGVKICDEVTLNEEFAPATTTSLWVRENGALSAVRVESTGLEVVLQPVTVNVGFGPTCPGAGAVQNPVLGGTKPFD